MRRAGILAVAALLALAGVIGLIAFLQSRDDAGIGGSRSGPGVEALGETSERLRPGNVLLTYKTEADGAKLRALSEEVAGEADPALEEAGQAIIVERRPDQATAVVARAWQRRLETNSADDPTLRAFAESWLGQGAMP